MKKISPWLLAVFSGVIGFLGYVGFNQFYLEWVFMVPLLWAIRDKTPGRVFLLGWLTGTVGHAGGFYWFSHMLTEFVGLNIFFAVIGLILYAAYNGLTFAIFAWGVNRLQIKKGWSVWWTAPVIWTAIENIYPFIFPNYLGASQYMLLPLIQIADVTGILGLSFLVVWCNAMVYTLLENRMMQEKLPETLFDKMGKPVLFGAYTAERKDGEIKSYVSALLVDEKLRVQGRYDKHILVPFGEYIPLGDLFPKLYHHLPYTTRFWPGQNIAPLEFKDYRLQVNLCYEDIFPDRIRQNMVTGIFIGVGQPHAIINLTNDSWYGDTFEPIQHLANAAFRAIEHRRTLVRSTNTGISAIIDPVGRLDKRTGQWTQEIFSGNVPMMTGRTIYSYGGNWLGVITLLISTITIGLTFISKRRKV